MTGQSLTTLVGAVRNAVPALLTAAGGGADDTAARVAVFRALAARLAEARGLTPAWEAGDLFSGVDARSLTPESLGSLYEGLLGFVSRRAPADQPVLFVGQDDPLPLTPERLAACSPLERALLGKDPPRVVDEVPPGAWYLHPVLAQRKGAGAFYTSNPLAGPTAGRTLAPFAVGARQGVLPRVIDPAMGCGAFLLAALRRLAPEGRRHGQVLAECLFGCDTDPVAVEIARLALWLEAGDEDLPLAALTANLRHADGLAQGGEETFDAVIGNPPWEIVKPNSREFFAGHDPFFRRLGKRAALARQRELFAADPALQGQWCEYVERHREFSRRVRDDGRFRLQGGGDLNTYKLFLERGLALLKAGGRLGMIVPSGLYCDLGAAELRRHLLERCDWRWLFMFENREGIFDIHRSYKFGPIVVEKGGPTGAVNVAFMRRGAAEWAAPELHATAYPRQRVARFSPEAHAFLEIRDRGELELLERIFDHSVLLGEPREPQPAYRREFDLTNHVDLFETPARLERAGFVRDRFGRFVDREGLVRALPLYQGVMVQPFDCAAVQFVGGRGSRADWRDLGWEEKVVSSRFAVRVEHVLRRAPAAVRPRLAFRDVQNATNERTMIATLIPGYPCGNTLPTFGCGDPLGDLELLPALASFPLDRVLRLKMSQNHVNWFYVRELPVPREVPAAIRRALLLPAAALALAGDWFAPEWLRLERELGLAEGGWRSRFALTPHERLRRRCALDAVLARLYGLGFAQFRCLLRECDLPAADLRKPAIRRSLDPKGFWRVDRDREPVLRHTVLALAAAADLENRIGAGAEPEAAMAGLLGSADDPGWPLPEELALADLGLGRGRAAVERRPVRSLLGPRLLPWQEVETSAASWRECERLADDLRSPVA